MICSLCKGVFNRTALNWKTRPFVINTGFYKASNLILCRYSQSIRKSVLEYDRKQEQEEYLHPKVIYNSRVHKTRFLEKKRLEKHAKKTIKVVEERVVPISLKYLDNFPIKTAEPPPAKPEEDNGPVNLPYASAVLSDVAFDNRDLGSKSEPNFEEDFVQTHISDHPVKSGKQWMNDYEKYTGNEEEMGDSAEDWQIGYGTTSLETPVSKVPCGGCGAFLHCQDTAIPGYLPSEIFKECSEKDLRALTCQRCHFMKNYNTALSVSVDKAEYPKIISKIKDENALVMIMVDLTDFPCSIWPDIFKIIGKDKNVFVIGNKIDLLWGDSRGWLKNVHSVLRSCFPSNANIQHIALISAKTGFGVEELITKLHNVWQYRGNVYLVGCTNVGKSTLFNSLLQSDYCKVKAVDLIQRATTAPWPGTTLNLLKFPILRPEGWRLHLRTQRLIEVNKLSRMERKLMKQQLQESKIKISPPQLIGHIGRTFERKKPELSSESFNLPNRLDRLNTPIPGSGLDPNDPDFEKTKWCYDTPGVLHEDQILDLLTTEELMNTVPKAIIEPCSFLLHPGWTLFIGGLARLDYLTGKENIRATVFCSSQLPITICQTTNADEVYEKSVGTSSMLVPCGRPLRLKEWPGLTQGDSITFSGIDVEESCGDIVLSSAGWVSITPPAQSVVKLLPWTPLRRGIHARFPSLLPHAVSLRGPKFNKSPAYGKTKPFI